MNKISEEKIIYLNDKTVILEFSIPGSSEYFNGHFPAFPVLPAIAQIHIIMHFVSRFLGAGKNTGLSEIKKAKFTNIIRPDTTHVLYLEKNEKNISFKIISTDEKTVYSAGNLTLQEV